MRKIAQTTLLLLGLIAIMAFSRNNPSGLVKLDSPQNISAKSINSVSPAIRVSIPENRDSATSGRGPDAAKNAFSGNSQNGAQDRPIANQRENSNIAQSDKGKNPKSFTLDLGTIEDLVRRLQAERKVGTQCGGGTLTALPPFIGPTINNVLCCNKDNNEDISIFTPPAPPQVASWTPPPVPSTNADHQWDDIWDYDCSYYRECSSGNCSATRISNIGRIPGACTGDCQFRNGCIAGYSYDACDIRCTPTGCYSSNCHTVFQCTATGPISSNPTGTAWSCQNKCEELGGPGTAYLWDSQTGTCGCGQPVSQDFIPPPTPWPPIPPPPPSNDCLNCSIPIRDASVTVTGFGKEYWAAQWPNSRINAACPNGQNCWDYVISQSISRGYNPVLILARWGAESGFSSYENSPGQRVYDLGCVQAGTNNNLSDQLACTFNTLDYLFRNGRCQSYGTEFCAYLRYWSGGAPDGCSLTNNPTTYRDNINFYSQMVRPGTPGAPSGGCFGVWTPPPQTDPELLAISPVYQADSRWRDYKCLGKSGCGIASLTAILNYFGINVTPREVVDKVDANGGYSCDAGSVGSVLVAVAKEYGLQYRQISWSEVRNSISAGRPVLASFRSYGPGWDHISVVRGVKDGRVYFSDSAEGYSNYPEGDVTGRFSPLYYYSLWR